MNYQECKAELKCVADDFKAHIDDLPFIRQVINDHADLLCKSNRLTDQEKDWLHSYAADLHPKEKTKKAKRGKRILYGPLCPVQPGKKILDEFLEDKETVCPKCGCKSVVLTIYCNNCQDSF